MCESCNLSIKFCNTSPSKGADLRSVKIHSHFIFILMKKLVLGLMTAFALLTIIPTQSKAEMKAKPASAVTKPVESASAEDLVIIERMKEYKAMDKSKLTQPQRRHYRNEYRSDRSHLRSHSTVYVTGGGLLLVVVLLIILL